MVRSRRSNPEHKIALQKPATGIGAGPEFVGQADAEAFIAALKYVADIKRSREKSSAAKQTAQCCKTGRMMLEIIARLRPDHITMTAALLLPLARSGLVHLFEVETRFGGDVFQLLVSLLKLDDPDYGSESVKRSIFLDDISHLGEEPQAGWCQSLDSAQTDEAADDCGFHQQFPGGERLRKKLVDAIPDVRVALVLIAEKTCEIREAKNLSQSLRKQIAQQIYDIYLPLCHRLGLGNVKWELEDWCFRYLDPDNYFKMSKLLDSRRLDREALVASRIGEIQTLLRANNIDGEVNGRAKNLYGIWKKMQRKHVEFDEVYDAIALRILVENRQQCYQVMDIIHQQFSPIPEEFDDYISKPKENGYRSLHTAVRDTAGKHFEVQIRTKKMHEDAEAGFCAHWRYKKSEALEATQFYEEKIAWLRRMLEENPS